MRRPASRAALLAVVLLAAPWPSGASGAPVPPVTPEAVPGGVAVVPIRPMIEGEEPPLVQFGSRRVLVMEAGGTWQAIIGLPLALVPGQYIVTITPVGRAVWSQTFEVRPKRYPVVRAAPGESTFAGITLPVRDMELVPGALSGWREDLGNALPLAWPVDGSVVTPFGLQRVRTDGEMTTEQGLAIRPAAPGRMIEAPGSSVVAAVFERGGGEAVLLDHGRGVFSLLYPLQQVQVEQNERLVRGHPLGYPAPVTDTGAGSTGAAASVLPSVLPSVLHWAVSINAAWVDPALLVGP